MGLKTKSIMNTGKVVLGTLAGFAIGAITGILFAPEKGSSIRKRLMDKSSESLDGLKSKFSRFRNSITEKLKSTEKDAEGFSVEGKAKCDDENKAVKNVINDQIEKDLNSKILKITMMIKDHHPELSEYLEEMPVTVPSENDPEISLNHLKSYYESLISLLKRYKVDYSKIEN